MGVTKRFVDREAVASLYRLGLDCLVDYVLGADCIFPCDEESARVVEKILERASADEIREEVERWT